MVGSSTTRPAFCRPIMARKRPIPLMVAILKDAGMARMRAARAPLKASARNKSPSMKTAARATCQEIPIWVTTPKVK